MVFLTRIGDRFPGMISSRYSLVCAHWQRQFVIVFSEILFDNDVVDLEITKPAFTESAHSTPITNT
jgi:hypothetical protein